VDSEFGEDFAKYEERDPWLNASSLKYIATVWSGIGDFRSELVSPLRGSMHSLPKTLLFAGDYELFYPDLVTLRDKMEAEDVHVDFSQASGGLHVFPLIPVPEGLRAQQQIVDALRLV
jgi:acetyl esterase/lipase